MKLEITDFSKGLNISQDPSRLPEGYFSGFKGVSADRFNRLVPGHVVANYFVPTYAAYSFHRFQSLGASHFFTAVWDNIGEWSEVYFNEDEGGAANLIYTGASRPGGETFFPIRFAQSRDRLYFTDPWGSIQTWFDGIPGGDAIQAGVSPPPAFAAPIYSAGQLNTTDKAIPYYEWKLTYVSLSGDESNGSDSVRSGSLTDQLATFSIANPNSTYLHITKGRIYRRGGDSTGFYLVGEVTFEDPQNPGYATSETFADNTLDVDVGTTPLPTNNFRFPMGLDGLVVHKERLFAWSTRGYASDSIIYVPFPNSGYVGPLGPTYLWYSGYSHLEMTGNGADIDPTDGGFIQLPGGNDDPIINCSSAGSVLIIGRRRSVYALFGNSHEDFALSQRSNVGIAGPNAICRGYNDVYFIGSDRRIYRLGDGDPEWISQGIQDALDARTEFELTQSHLAFASGSLLLVFANTRNVDGDHGAYIMNVREGSSAYWSEISLLAYNHLGARPSADTFAVLQVRSCPGFDEAAVSGFETMGRDIFLYLFGNNASYSDPSVYGGDVGKIVPTTTTVVPEADIPEVLLEREVDVSGEFGGAKLRALTVLLEGAVEGDSFLVRVDADDVYYVLGVNPSTSVARLLDKRLPGHLIGERIRISLIGENITRLDIRRIRMDYEVYRHHP